MSRGTQSYTFRLPPELVAHMQETIKSRNERTSEAPWTWSDFVRSCIEAKLAHRKRGRAPKAPKAGKVAAVETYQTINYAEKGEGHVS